MSNFLFFLMGMVLFFSMYYLLSLTLSLTVLNYFKKIRSDAYFGGEDTKIPEVKQELPIPKQNNRIIIGTKKFNFNDAPPLKAFNNAYDRTIYAIEEQHFEDWVDALDKIFKMLKKDFFGTIKNFFSFLINLSKPLETEDFETRMAKLNSQRQQMEVEKMVSKIKDQNSIDTINLEQNNLKTLPSQITVNSNNSVTKIGTITNGNLVPNVLKTKIILKKNSDDDISVITETTTEDSTNLTEFDKFEQRLLNKLSTSGTDNYDLWLDLANLYIKNNANNKAKEIFTYVAKNAKDGNKQKAINGLIGLD